MKSGETMLRSTYTKIKKKAQKFYYERKQKKLKNRTPSIISNNCIGGVIYHDMGLKFLSPTINLWFKTSDFLAFVKDLKYYLNCDIEETFEEGKNYPIGLLKKGDTEIRVYFMHYQSFAEAKKHWIERSKRIDYNNLYIILEHPSPLLLDSDTWKNFSELDIKNKIIITGDTEFQDEHIVHLNIYEKGHFPGKILHSKGKFSIKRYLDDFDYISFFNQ